jgi:lipopolysaccharide transport system ATP-binding protein
VKDPVLIFDNVSKSYPLYHHVRGGLKNFLFNLPKAMSTLKVPHFEALRDISFEVQRGETFGIIGKNGVGKSTLLGLVAGVLRPNKGTVIVKNRVSPLLNGVLMGLYRNEVLKKLDEIIEFSELEEFIDQPIRTYSSGMLARLGFSVVSSLNPEILLIDEILAVGDAKFQTKCLDRMIHFKKTNVTMVLVSHYMPNIERICDRVIWIENHMIKMIGETKTVVKSYDS